MGASGAVFLVQHVIDGKVNYVVECNPRFGPKAFATLKDYAAGKTIPAKIINPDRDYTAQNAKAGLAGAY